MIRLLLIEDEPLIIKMYSRALAAAGFEIAAATNGPDGLRLAVAKKPDLILLDIMMPMMSGLEVLQRLKKKDSLKDIPVIMLTNLSDEGEVRATTLLGAVAFIVKSEIEPKQLVAKVKEILANKRPHESN